MSNSTNFRQLELLVNLMESNPDIANGFTTERGKDDLKEFWKKVEVELNCLGPPIKCVAEWKKVWLDKKKYIRGKLTDNTKHKKGTGGGPFKEFKFTDLEEAIINLCAMRDSIEGIPDSAAFGLPSCSRKRSFPETVNSNGEVSQQTATTTDKQDSFKIAETTTTKSPSQKKITSQECFMQELNIQKEISAKIGEAVDDMKNRHQENIQSFKEIYQSMQNLHDIQKQIFEETQRHHKEIEEENKKKNEEEKRHHIAMENFRAEELKTKINFKHKTLEIKTETLQKMI